MNKHHILALACLLGLFLAACQAEAGSLAFPPGSAGTPPAVIVASAASPLDPSVQVTKEAAAAGILLAPAETVVYSPTPRLLGDLVERLPFDAQAPGLAVALYRLNQPVVAEEIGYPQIHAELQQESRWVQQTAAGMDYRAALLEKNNLLLAAFDCRLARNQPSTPVDLESYTLYQGEQVLVEGIESFSPVSANRSQTDFLMLVELSSHPGVYQLVRRDSVTDWKAGIPGVPQARPQFLGDDVLYAALTDGRSGAEMVNVYRDDAQIYQAAATEAHVRPPLVGLWAYDEHWALEVLDSISIDGQALNAAYGYARSYEFRLLEGKPLFLFEKDGRAGLSYAGQEILLPGETIEHYNCCSGTLLNPMQAGEVFVFLLRQGEQWFYVEVAASAGS